MNVSNLTPRFQTGRNRHETYSMFCSHTSYRSHVCCSDSLLLSSNKTNQIKLRCGSNIIIEWDCTTPGNSSPFIFQTAFTRLNRIPCQFVKTPQSSLTAPTSKSFVAANTWSVMFMEVRCIDYYHTSLKQQQYPVIK